MDGYLSIPPESRSLQTLARLLSPQRFDTFVRAAGGDLETALRLYAWNIEISSAFWGSFHMLEVSLRNTLHTQLVTLAKRDDWWNARLLLPRDSKKDLLHNDTKKIVQEAISTAKGKQTAKGEELESGHVVAELSFGFWIGMLANRYHQRLWEKTFVHTFPHYTGLRIPLHDDLERLRKLRNRIAHHEPIFKRNLAIDHDKICGLIGYIEPEARVWVMNNSQIPKILSLKEQRLNGQLESSF